ncbi:glycosyl transferase, partial [Escherichia coli]|nr:glycosyl transferase [Escherichia coli]
LEYVERKISLALSKYPKVRDVIKFFYLYIASLFGIILNKNKTVIQSKIYEISIDDSEESFFGYYDHSPMSSNGRYVLFHSSAFSTKRHPKKVKYISICVKDLLNNKVYKLYDTRAFNWQQGSRLMWIDDDNIIFNDYENNGYISVVYSLSLMKVIKKINYPIYDVNNYKAVTLDFSWLAKYDSDYGYYNKKSFSTDISIINLNTGGIELFLSLDEMLKRTNFKCNIDVEHVVNHFMFAPDGRSVMFIHRYYTPKGKRERLIHWNLINDNVRVLINESIISHCCWNGNDEIIGFFGAEIDSLNYYRLSIESCNTEKLFFDARKYSDGHPTIVHNRYIISDTYPDKNRIKKLFVYDLV